MAMYISQTAARAMLREASERLARRGVEVLWCTRPADAFARGSVGSVVVHCACKSGRLSFDIKESLLLANRRVPVMDDQCARCGCLYVLRFPFVEMQERVEFSTDLGEGEG